MDVRATGGTVAHSTFSVERIYPATPDRVFRAFRDPERKRRWFAEGEGWIVEEYELDFRVGGAEKTRFRPEGGPPMGNDTMFMDIVPDRRIVLAYTMSVGDVRHSVSLATVEIESAADGSRLVYTEQAAFLDGADAGADRKAGCRELLEMLDRELRDHP